MAGAKRENIHPPERFAETDASLLNEARSIVRVFQVFANIDRAMILFMVAAQSGLTANDVVNAMKISRPHAYQHLKRLAAGGWIKPVRRGPARAYICSNIEVHLLLTSLRNIALTQYDIRPQEHESPIHGVVTPNWTGFR